MISKLFEGEKLQLSKARSPAKPNQSSPSGGPTGYPPSKTGNLRMPERPVLRTDPFQNVPSSPDRLETQAVRATTPFENRIYHSPREKPENKVGPRKPVISRAT